MKTKLGFISNSSSASFVIHPMEGNFNRLVMTALEMEREECERYVPGVIEYTDNTACHLQDDLVLKSWTEANWDKKYIYLSRNNEWVKLEEIQTHFYEQQEHLDDMQRKEEYGRNIEN
jgi:hypothetical protein